MTALNYATQYSQALAQAYPYVLYFAALFQTENDDRYRWLNSNTIEIPSITTTGRVDSDRDTITMATRNYANAWEPKKLTNHRKWSTLVHPRDIIETNHVASIQNCTIVPQSLGGSSYVDMPMNVYLSNDKTLGTVTIANGVPTFKADAAAE